MLIVGVGKGIGGGILGFGLLLGMLRIKILGFMLAVVIFSMSLVSMPTLFMGSLYLTLEISYSVELPFSFCQN